jgi:hypothetical protein
VGRIRSIKPEFLRHEGLQDLEKANPGKCCMLVFAGLWTACDKLGRFEWRPRTLKLDILPFLPFDMAETLELLEGAGQLRRYVVDGKEYGVIDTFEEHQRITGKEATAPAKYPEPPSAKPVKRTGIDGETPETHPGAQEGKGREEEREEEGEGSGDAHDEPATPTLPTMAGAVCITLKAKGIPDVQPSHPDLLALLEAGTDIGSFAAAAEKAVKAGKGKFAYVLAVVKGQAADSARLAAQARASPSAAQAKAARDAESKRILGMKGGQGDFIDG